MTDTAPSADWRTNPEQSCLLCGATRRAVTRARGELTCGTTDPYTGELEAEFTRHRFKPWMPKEVEAHHQQEQRIAQEMGDMAAWWQREGQHKHD